MIFPVNLASMKVDYTSSLSGITLTKLSVEIPKPFKIPDMVLKLKKSKHHPNISYFI